MIPYVASVLQDLYRHANNLVLHGFQHKIYFGLESMLTSHIKDVVASVKESHDTLFLEEVNEQWKKFFKALQMIRDISTCVDSTSILGSRKTPVYELGLNLWRDNIIHSPNFKKVLNDTLLEIVYEERASEVINSGLMTETVKMLKDLGPSVYQLNYEKPFLEILANFYREESQQLIGCCDCGDYLRRAENRLNEGSRYLDAESEVKRINVVEQEMIESHMIQLVRMETSGLVKMIVDDKYEDLARMYKMFERVPNGLVLLQEEMASYVRKTGKQLVTDPERLIDPTEFVQTLWELIDKHQKAIIHAFNNDIKFQNALNSSLQYFIGLNSSTHKMISLFVDGKLRKGLKGFSQDDVDIVLEKVFMIFHHLPQKDIFWTYLKTHLVKRLLRGRSRDQEAVRIFILKLEKECGDELTLNKEKNMLTDIATSPDVTQGFYEAMGSELANLPKMAVHLLKIWNWPTQLSRSNKLPTEILSLCDKFETHFHKSYFKRRLTWQTNLGSADIIVRFGNGKKYELNVSTYQMCILMLFNEADQLNYTEIEQAVEIPGVELKRCLLSLSSARENNILKKVPLRKYISENDNFFFNQEFSSKFYKVKISEGNELKAEIQDMIRRLEKDRHPNIDAAIVRIMKEKRLLDHNTLVAETTEKLESMFIPTHTVIAERINDLIRREVLGKRRKEKFIPILGLSGIISVFFSVGWRGIALCKSTGYTIMCFICFSLFFFW